MGAAHSVRQSMFKGEPETALDQYLQELDNSSPLSRQEEAELAQQIREGNTTALQTLVTANLRFVVKIAKHYQGYGVALEDLVAEGNVGLMTAAEKFDETKGVKFITYAVWWIRQRIHIALGQFTRPEYVPLNVAQVRTQVAREMQNLSYVPTPEEMAERTGLPLVDVTRALMSVLSSDVELDAPAFIEGTSTIGDQMQDTHAVSPMTYAMAHSEIMASVESIRSVLAYVATSISTRSAHICRLRFGITEDGTLLHEGMILEDIGDRLGLTRERIRQIVEQTFVKLQKGGVYSGDSKQFEVQMKRLRLLEEATGSEIVV